MLQGTGCTGCRSPGIGLGTSPYLSVIKYNIYITLKQLIYTYIYTYKFKPQTGSQFLKLSSYSPMKSIDFEALSDLITLCWKWCMGQTSLNWTAHMTEPWSAFFSLQVDLHGILSMVPLPLSQGVVLSLLQQLACDINNDTPRKLGWMTEVAAAINPADPMIAMHVRPIFEQVYQILNHQRSMPTISGAELSNIRLLMHVINSMLMTCKWFSFCFLLANFRISKPVIWLEFSIVQKAQWVLFQICRVGWSGPSKNILLKWDCVLDCQLESFYLYCSTCFQVISLFSLALY